MFDFIESCLLWIVLLPLAGAMINGLLGRTAERPVVHGVAIGSVAGSFILALLCFIEIFVARGQGVDHPVITYEVYEWFNLSVGPFQSAETTVPLMLTFTMDSLSSVMTLVVTGIGLLIHIYSTGYMDTEKSFARFFCYLNLFMASMLILVLGSSLPVMFVGWEGVGLCSYLLIGFWYENPAYAAAGKKAFIANRVGDFGVLIGMFLLLLIAHSLEFSEINALASEGLGAFRSFDGPFVNLLGAEVEIGSVVTMACLFLFLGCCGKSAQIPLYVWLPDAMAGPTPVSALIHAATMVTAGVYLCCRLSPLFSLSPTAMSVIAIVGTLTALLAASVAVVQNEMKKILAYSTVSQLGFMFAAVGVGAFAAGFFHVFTHAFFKACLFLGAGAVMHAVHAHGDADIRKLGGLRKILPKTHWTFLASCLAIAGFPLTSGFFSKDEILLGATSVAYGEQEFLPQWVGHFVFVGLFIAATMTAFYMFRLYFLTFTGEYRSGGDDDDGHGYAAHPHANGANITVPLAILGGGALVVGFLGIPHLMPFTGIHLPNWWSGWMEASMAHPVSHDDMTAVNAAAVGGLLAMALGIGLAGWKYYDKNEDTFTTKIPAPIYSFLFDKWRVDEFYGRAFLGPIRWLSDFSARFDAIVVDGGLTKVGPFVVRSSGWLISRLQSGVVYTYGAFMCVGLALSVWWFLYPHPSFQAEVEGASATLTADPGFGYEYRWDFDYYDEVEFDTDWTSRASVEHRFEPSQFVAYGVNASLSRGGFETHRVDEDTFTVPEDFLPAGWAEDPENATPPVFMVGAGGELVLRRNDARSVGVQGQPPVTGEELVVNPGQVVQIRGQQDGMERTRNLAISGFVYATLTVRNAFGNQAKTCEEIEILPATADAQALALGRTQ